MAKILIAEDERDIRELIEFTLTAYAGHQVFKAANGQEAVDMAPSVLPDLIMMDVRMPKMTGYEACRELKKIDTVKNIPVVFLSAKGQESEIDTGLDAGAYDYILKPFAPDQLATRVAEILQKFQNEQKAATSNPAPAMPSAPAVVPTAVPAPSPAAIPTPTTAPSSAAAPTTPTAPVTPDNPTSTGSTPSASAATPPTPNPLPTQAETPPTPTTPSSNSPDAPKPTTS